MKRVKYMLQMSMMYIFMLWVFVVTMQSLAGRSTFDCYIDGIPSTDCIVELDGRLMGNTPQMINMGFGLHAVTIYPPKNVRTVPEFDERDRTLYPFTGHAFVTHFYTVSPIQVPSILLNCYLDGKPLVGCFVMYNEEELGETPLDVTLDGAYTKTFEVFVPDNIEIEQSSKYVLVSVFDVNATEVAVHFVRP